MFPMSKEGERFRDPSSPKIAVYSAHPTSKPTVRVHEVNAAPGSRTRSALRLLQEQKKAATSGWTSSSIHSPSSQAYLHGTLPAAPTDNVDIEQPESMENNLREQVRLLEAQLSHYKGQNVTNAVLSPAFSGNGAGQYPATTLAPPVGAFPPQPLAYATPPGPTVPPPISSIPTAPGVHQATLGYPHGARHFPVTHEQPNTGAVARFQKLSSPPQKSVSKGTLPSKQPPPAMPAVETHHTQLLEELQRQQQVNNLELSKMQTDVAVRDAHRVQLEQELLQLRRSASESNAVAKKARDELEALLARRAGEMAARNEIETKLQSMQQRYDFICEELAIAKRELDAERKIPKYQPPSADVVGGMLSYGQLGPMNDFSCTKLASDNEVLRSQVTELESALQHRDAHIDHLSKTNTSLMEECEKLRNDLRHEEQKKLLSFSTTESHKVLLGDAQAEAEYLRIVTAEQRSTIERMAKDHEERFERIRSEMEARQARELHAQNALENAKSLHVEASRIHQALVSEQGINEVLRGEIQTLQRKLSEEQQRSNTLLSQFESLRVEIQAKEKEFVTQTSNMEAVLSQWQSQLARQASEERGQLQHASQVLQSLKALELPSRNGALSPQSSPLSTTVAVNPTVPAITSPVHLIPEKTNSSSYLKNLEETVNDVLKMEQACRRDAEESRKAALAALVMHNKSLETPSTTVTAL